MRDDDARPKDRLPEGPRAGRTLTEGRVLPPRPPLPPERTTVSAPMLTADASADESVLGDERVDDRGDDSAEGDHADEADGFLDGATLAEVAVLPMANEATRVTLVPRDDDHASMAADKTLIAVVDFAALNADRAPSDVDHDDNGVDDDDDNGVDNGVDFDAPTAITSIAGGDDVGVQAPRTQPRRDITSPEHTAPDARSPSRPLWAVGAISFGVVSLILIGSAYACAR